MKIECDVLVVGAGPAGLTAAFFLSKNGISTMVLERNKSPGLKKTSYDITEGSRIHNILNEMMIKPQKISNVSEWFSPNNRFLLYSKIEDYYFKRGPEGDSLENILTNRVQNHGVKLLLNSKIQTIKIKKNRVESVQIIMNKEKKELKPDFIIAADGPESTLRKKLHVTIKKLAVFQGYGIIGKIMKKNIYPHAKIYFDERIAPGGYVYSGSVANEVFFCVVTDKKCLKNISLKEKLTYFLKKNIDCKYTINNYFSGSGTAGLQTTVVGNVLFIGSAAGFYDTFLGYGLNYAIESANVAVDALKKDNIQIYEKYSKTLQTELKDRYVAREIWRKADNSFFDSLLNAFDGQYDGKDKKINKLLKLFDEN